MTRKETVDEVKSFLSSFKNQKPSHNSETQTMELFSDYYDSEGSLFESYTLPNRYNLLVCSEYVDDETEVFNFVLTYEDSEDIVAEIDFDDFTSLQSFVGSCDIKIKINYVKP